MKLADLPPFKISKWSAWIPEPVCTLSSPPVQFLPISLRKRLSDLTKMSLWVANKCLPLDCESVFASRHGEAHLTVELLNQIVTGSELSAQGFARSVHNFSSGLFTIAAKSTTPTTALAAGKDTFKAGLIESALKRKPVLFVMADEALPDQFVPYIEEEPANYALAFYMEPSSVPLPLEILDVPNAALRFLDDFKKLL